MKSQGQRCTITKYSLTVFPYSCVVCFMLVNILFCLFGVILIKKGLIDFILNWASFVSVVPKESVKSFVGSSW